MNRKMTDLARGARVEPACAKSAPSARPRNPPPASKKKRRRLTRQCNGPSDDFDLMCSDPAVDLANSHLPRLLVLPEEVSGMWVFAVNPKAEQLVPIARAAVFPGARGPQCIFGNTAETLAQFFRRLIKL